VPVRPTGDRHIAVSEKLTVMKPSSFAEEKRQVVKPSNSRREPTALRPQPTALATELDDLAIECDTAILEAPLRQLPETAKGHRVNLGRGL